MNLLDQRCWNHSLREAVAQCPTCKRFFCRECVTEHAGRIICASCVQALTGDTTKTARTARARWTITALAGILIAWLVFYYLGLALARIPSKFHEVQNRDHRERSAPEFSPTPVDPPNPPSGAHAHACRVDVWSRRLESVTIASSSVSFRATT